MEPGRHSCAHGSAGKKGESTHVFASRAFVTVTLAANMRGPHGPHFPRQLVSHSPTHWITQDALLDMIDAIDTNMNRRPGALS